MLEVEGRAIMSQGEFRELMAHLDEGRQPNSGVLQGWWAGEQFGPEAVYAALEIDAGLVADDRGQVLIDTALARLRDAFPELVAQT